MCESLKYLDLWSPKNLFISTNSLKLFIHAQNNILQKVKLKDYPWSLMYNIFLCIYICTQINNFLFLAWILIFSCRLSCSAPFAYLVIFTERACELNFKLPSMQRWHCRFTPVPLKPLSDQVWTRYQSLYFWKMIIFNVVFYCMKTYGN